MRRFALVPLVLIAGCASGPPSRDTCNFVGESSRLDVTHVALSQSENARWLDEVGLSTRRYRRTYWYRNGDDIRLVCLYTSQCKAKALAYRKTDAGWQQFEPPDAALLCVLVTPGEASQ
jgi:hypothetical protein